MHRFVVVLAVIACGSRPSAWTVPAGYKHETLTFPLDFAPSLAHRGTEDLQFPPGFYDERSPSYWSYVFLWRIEDPAMLDDAAVAAELTTYYRGLLVYVDGDKHRIDPSAITVQVEGGAIRAHILDTFGSAAPVDLEGTAKRTSCGSGAVWAFVLAPHGSPARAQLDALAAAATCGGV